MNSLAEQHSRGHKWSQHFPSETDRSRMRNPPRAEQRHESRINHMPRIERLGARRSLFNKFQSSSLISLLIGSGALILAGISYHMEKDLYSIPFTTSIAFASVILFALALLLHRKLKHEERIRSEKDALIAELEQARAHSDEARRRAEELNLAKSRFLATMSHELRTPLNAILGFSEVMETEILGEHHVPAYRDYAHDIHISGKHLLELINEILDLSRIEAGRFELQESDIRLDATIATCAHLVDHRAQKKSIALLLIIEPSMPMIYADERAIRQVALNLLSNAIKFTHEGGEVMIRTGMTEDGQPYLQVNDTGPGIPAHEIPIIMENFGRGSLAVKLAEQGTGLGLPIVRSLVTMHGGDFKIESREGEGTSVTVTFPADRIRDMPLTALAAHMAERIKKAAA